MYAVGKKDSDFDQKVNFDIEKENLKKLNGWLENIGKLSGPELKSKYEQLAMDPLFRLKDSQYSKKSCENPALLITYAARANRTAARIEQAIKNEKAPVQTGQTERASQKEEQSIIDRNEPIIHESPGIGSNPTLWMWVIEQLTIIWNKVVQMLREACNNVHGFFYKNTSADAVAGSIDKPLHTGLV